MLNLTPQGQTLVDELAARYNLSADAVVTVMQAVIRAGGRAAQFSHPELGGSCQWMSGGMTMTGEMGSHTLKAKIDGLCTDIADALGSAGGPAEAPGLYVPDAARSTGHWWPFTLGSPAAAGSQNKVSYALFPSMRRLAVETKGHVTLYDTGDHQISGLSQQQGDSTDLTFITSNGPLRLDDLNVIDPDGGLPPPGPAIAAASPAAADASPADPATAAPTADPLATIERLSALKDKGILTAEEFAAKKAELLRRL